MNSTARGPSSAQKRTLAFALPADPSLIRVITTASLTISSVGPCFDDADAIATRTAATRIAARHATVTLNEPELAVLDSPCRL